MELWKFSKLAKVNGSVYYSMDCGGNGSTSGRACGHDRLYFVDITIVVDGYLMVFLSNENEDLVKVFWDDFLVNHHYKAALQPDDYYPFALTFNSNQRGFG